MTLQLFEPVQNGVGLGETVEHGEAQGLLRLFDSAKHRKDERAVGMGCGMVRSEFEGEIDDGEGGAGIGPF